MTQYIFTINEESISLKFKEPYEVEIYRAPNGYYCIDDVKVDIYCCHLNVSDVIKEFKQWFAFKYKKLVSQDKSKLPPSALKTREYIERVVE
jgi:hypothetical protein